LQHCEDDKSGTGPEVAAEGVKVLQAVAKLENLKFELTNLDWSGNRYLKTGAALPDDGLDRLRKFDAILLDVDNGPPTEPDASRSQSGSTEGGRGLAGMQERVAAVGGAFAAGPTPEGGFQVRLSLPVAARSK